MISAVLRARASAAILVAAAVLAFAPAAGAAKTVHQRAHLFAELSGKATNGFSFFLFSFDHSAVLSLTGLTGRHGSGTVNYSAFKRRELSSLADGRIDLKIGGRGHFHGRLVTKSTKTEEPEKGCKGNPSTTEEGFFVGSFVFHGERGYTTIQAPRASGAIIRRGAIDCQITTGPGRHSGSSKKGQQASEKAAEMDEFRLVAGKRKGDLVLLATREQVPPGSKHTMSTFEVTAEGPKVGAFDVYRSAFVVDTGSDAGSNFLTPNQQEPLAEAVIEPPAPFSGAATFQLEGPKKASWNGDLAVELPGAGKLPLTGDELYAGACRGHSNCTATLPRPLSELLEAGGSFSVGTIREKVDGTS
jgi:hypothetical protein